MEENITPWFFNPIMFQIGPFQAHWYGFMYAMTFILGYLYVHKSAIGKKSGLSAREKDGILVAGILGIILGGRLGYVLFYNLPYYLVNPQKILAVWEGGMASHGALIGILIALGIYCHSKKIRFLAVSDLIAGFAPIGIILVRLGNFINGELYGRVASSWCIHFPTDPDNCRYPSQLIQAFLEGFVLLIILQIIGRKTKKEGLITGLFLVIYGIFRIIGELFREPDPQIGYYFDVITQGQILSGIMVIVGLILVAAKRKNWYNTGRNNPSSVKNGTTRKHHKTVQKGQSGTAGKKTKKSSRI